MGCASSKRIEVAADVYRPAPTSFAVFDIHAIEIEEPWLIANAHAQQEQDGKTSHVPELLLEKLNTLDDGTEAPQSWAEVSKALQTLKPTLDAPIQPTPPTFAPPPLAEKETHVEQKPLKNLSFHTVEELDVKRNPNSILNPNQQQDELRTAQEAMAVTVRARSNQIESKESGFRPVKQNVFLLRDRLEREKEGKQPSIDTMLSLRRDPLSDFPEKCPPGGSETVVIYTTSLGGIRRTFGDCNKVRDMLEWHRVVYDERDVSLHGVYLKEWKELLGEEYRLPRMFVKGRYVGGVEEVVELNETGRLGRILNAARVERGIGRQACEGCGGARFVPCFECGGSGKIAGREDGDGDTLIHDDDNGGNRKKKKMMIKKDRRCPKCNENGLVHCPACLL